MTDNNSEACKIPNICNYFCQFKPIHIKKGEIIFRPGLVNTNVFYIEKGYVKTYNISADGEEKIIMFYKSHNVFPLVKLFKNSEKNMFAEAITDVTLRSTNEKDFEMFLNKNQKVIWEFTNYLLDYVELYSQRIEDLGYMTAYPRLMSGLINLGKRFGIPEQDHIKVEIPITQRELAATIAMTRETVSREFEKLTKDGIVSIKDKGIVIKDINKLTNKLDGYGENG